MFVETNDPQLIIVNIDGLIKINGKRRIEHFSNNISQARIELDHDLADCLLYLSDTFELTIVSSFNQENLEIIANSCLNPSIKRFPATNFIEQYIIKRQICDAIKASDKKVCECIYVCGDITSIPQARKLRLGTIALCKDDYYGFLHEGPDFIVDTGNDIKQVLTNNKLGYLGEFYSTPSGFFKGSSSQQTVSYIYFPNKEFPQSPIWVSGRYFKRNDPRAKKHAFSLRLIDSKWHMCRHKKLFAEIIYRMISLVVKKEFDYVTRIPPKPSQKDDRLGIQLTEMGQGIFKKNGLSEDNIKLDLLSCCSDYTSQKDIGNYQARRDNVRGVFTLNLDVREKTVVVIDDITTSGSTLMEATEVLYKGGAKRIIPMALSYHPVNLDPFEECLKCPVCGGQLNPRYRNRDGQPFYGCENYHSNNCKGSMNFKDGVKSLNEMIKLEEEEPIDDIDF